MSSGMMTPDIQALKTFTEMPGKSFEGPLPSLSANELDTQKRLTEHVDVLSNSF